MGAQRLLRTTQYAAQDAGLNDLAMEVERFWQTQVGYLEKLGKARDALMRMRASDKSHDELVLFIEEQVTRLGDLTHPKKIEEEVQVAFLQHAVRNIELTSRLTKLRAGGCESGENAG